ncbi:peptidyl-tRNA hydrolase [Corynebacterium nasicanis]|uniref:peptidyl-tRNA hydrolase n=1 Tax=Corynebacterium nasicanis TaxID=1448267 RepID=A0ABW1QB41_9CORY
MNDTAHSLLRTCLNGGREEETIQAMQIALHVPKQSPPRRSHLMEAAARAVVAVCLAPEATTDPAWRAGLEGWYSQRIRKVARRARNTAWDNVQQIPGVTVTVSGAQARAFVPGPVAEVPAAIRKLQIQGTDLPPDEPGPRDPTRPLLLLDADLDMSIGKSAAQAGHAAMLWAAHLSAPQARAWAETGFALDVREVSHAEFAAHLTRPAAVTVQDAGFTEVAPGALTALALPAAGGR